MRILLFLPLLALFVIPAYAYNSGFQPIYQAISPTGGGINNTVSTIGLGESIVSGQVLNDHQFKGIDCIGTVSCSSNGTDILI